MRLARARARVAAAYDRVVVAAEVDLVRWEQHGRRLEELGFDPVMELDEMTEEREHAQEATRLAGEVYLAAQRLSRHLGGWLGG